MRPAFVMHEAKRRCAAPGCSNSLLGKHPNAKTCSDECRRALTRSDEATLARILRRMVAEATFVVIEPSRFTIDVDVPLSPGEVSAVERIKTAKKWRQT